VGSAGVYDRSMARSRWKDRQTTDEAVREEMRERLKARLEEWRDDPIPAEPSPQMRDAVRQAITYSGPVPIR
jgi:hypothetical protein